MAAAAGQVTGTALLVLPLALIVDEPWTLNPGLATWGALVLGERPGALVFVGMGLIFAGIAAIDGRALSRVRRLSAIVPN